MPIKGTYYNATLGAAPTSSQTSCLGCITNYSVTQTVPFTLSNNSYNNFTFTTSGLPIGVYLGIINASISPSSGTTRIGLGMNLISPTVNITVNTTSNQSVNSLYSGNDYQYMSSICIFTITNATTSTLSPSLYVGGGSTGGTLNYMNLYAIRIA